MSLILGLKNFDLEPDTLQLAKSLLNTAQLRTGPGSGHELDLGTAALPAICAYLACVRLNSTEVDLKTAQVASCVRSLVFKKSLDVVESVLKESEAVSPTKGASSTSLNSTERAYKKLLMQHKFRKNTEMLLSWLVDVEEALLASGELRPAEIKKLKDTQLLKCAVFGWTCVFIKSKNVSHAEMKGQHKLQEDAYDDMVRVLDSACSHIADKILQQQKDLRQQSKSPTKLPTNLVPTPTPTKLHRPISPTKSALKRGSSIFTPEHATPGKRKVAFKSRIDEEDEDIETGDTVMDTPSTKRAKLMLPTPSASMSPLTTKSDLTPRASSSHVTLDVEADEPMEVDAQPGRLLLPLPPRLSDVPPSTPRRNRRSNSSSPTKKTPNSKARKIPSLLALDHDTSLLSEPIRFRSIFVDNRQWVIRDPKVEREVRKGEDIKKKLLETYGESFIEKYRPVTVQ